jgi:hypothetical protein
MNLKKILGWALMILVAYWLLTHPNSQGVGAVFGWLNATGASLAGFLNHP